MDNQPKKTNVLCVAGLVCSFLIAPLGLILSIVGVSQVKKTGEDGKALGIAGIIVGALSTLIGIIVSIFALFAFLSITKEIAPIKEEFGDIVKDSTKDVSRVKAERYLKDACGELDAEGKYNFSDNEDYAIECEEFVCTLKTGSKTYTRSCKTER